MTKLRISVARGYDQSTLRPFLFPSSHGRRPRFSGNLGRGWTFTWLWLQVWTTR